MPDMILQHVDSLLAERIRSLAKDRRWSINEVLLHALRRGLGMATTKSFNETTCESQTLQMLDEHWGSAEHGAFQEAMRALAQTRPTQLAPENIRGCVPSDGAE